MRMRIDLDGIPLKNSEGRVLCIFRFRTTEGLVFAIPESIDVTVAWSAIAEASLDLFNGKMKVIFHRDATLRPKWLGDFDHVEGEWTDRQLLEEAPKS